MNREYALNLPTQGKRHPLSPATLLNAERCLRLNPHWAIEEFSEIDGVFTVKGRDHESEVPFELRGSICATDDDHFEISFEDGAYERILLFPQDDVYASRVTYRSPLIDEDSDREKQMVLWLRSIREYLRLYLNNGLNSLFFRFLMNKVLLTMTPSQRKISLMLIRFTVVELFVILLIVVGYTIFVLK